MMQTKIIAVLVALVVIVGGGAYAFATWGQGDTMMKDDSMMMHDDSAMQGDDAMMMHDEGDAMHDDAMMDKDMMASTSVDAMMH